MMIAEALLAGVLIALGINQMLQRTLTRIAIGAALVGQGANLTLLVTGGESGEPPLIGGQTPFSDPLPHALALTAIVIGFAMVGFLLALAWRAAQVDGEDRVEDELEDRRDARAEADLADADLADADLVDADLVDADADGGSRVGTPRRDEGRSS